MTKELKGLETPEMKAAQAHIVEVAKEHKEIKKQVELKPASDLHFKFDEVIIEGQGQLNFKAFNWGIFKGMDNEIQAALAPYKRIKDDTMYSNEYKDTKRVDSLLNAMAISDSYRDKALNQIEDLRKPEVTTAYIASSDQQTNMLKRVNNSIIFNQLIGNYSIEDMFNLFEDNKDNMEIRTMLKAKVHNLVATTKDHEQDLAIKLKYAIKEYEEEITNVEYFDELDTLERDIHYIFKEASSYRAGLENGIEESEIKRYFN